MVPADGVLVAVGGTGVLVAVPGTLVLVAVAGKGVLVAVAGSGVLVAVAGTEVLVAVGGTGVFVAVAVGSPPKLVARKEVKRTLAPYITCTRSPAWPAVRLLFVAVTSQVVGSVPPAAQALADRVLPTTRKRRL